MPRCQNVARVIDNRYIGETSALFKTELFVRQFMIPLNIALRTGLLNRPSAAEDAVVDEYLSIQRQVDCLPFQTSDSDFSYYNSLTFYKYFVDHLTAFTGDADKLNFFNKFKEIFMDLPKTVHAAWKKLARNDLKQRRRKKGRQIDLAMQLRVPNFILVAEQYSKEDLTKICVHLSHYFWVFSRPRESGVVFNFDSRLPLLGLHLQALHDCFDVSVLTLVAEDVKACYRTDTRSVFSSDLHGFGVGSYASHGCGRHTSVSLPCLSDNNMYVLQSTYSLDIP
jgi:hypothetical protein